MRKNVKPVREPLDRGGIKETHPAYATIQVSHSHGGGAHLFGSKVKSVPSRVRITIYEATRYIEYGLERAFGIDPYIEVEMTHAQFVAMVGMPNTGSGVPCTLQGRRTDTGWDRTPLIEIEDDATEVAASVRALREKTEEIAASIYKMKDEALAVASGLSQAKKRDLGQVFDRLIQQVNSNLPFAVTQAHESVENAVSAAQVEVESAMATFERRVGAAMVDQAVRTAIEGSSDEYVRLAPPESVTFEVNGYTFSCFVSDDPRMEGIPFMVTTPTGFSCPIHDFDWTSWYAENRAEYHKSLTLALSKR